MSTISIPYISKLYIKKILMKVNIMSMNVKTTQCVSFTIRRHCSV